MVPDGGGAGEEKVGEAIGGTVVVIAGVYAILQNSDLLENGENSRA